MKLTTILSLILASFSALASQPPTSSGTLIQQYPRLTNPPSSGSLMLIYDPTLTNNQTRALKFSNLVDAIAFAGTIAAGTQTEVQFRDSTTGGLGSSSNLVVRAGSLDIRTNMISKAIEGFTGGFGTVVAGGSQWERRGIAVVGGAADSYYVCEPSLIYAPNPQILTGVTSNVYKLWFSVGGYTIPSIGYAESQDGVNYTRRAGRLTTLDGYQRGQVVWTGTNYWFWGVRFPNSLAFDRFVSTDGITWSAAQTDVFTAAVTNTFTPALGNMSVLYHTNAPAWLTNATVWICTFDVCTNIAAPSLVPPNQWIDYCMVSQDGTNWSAPWRLAGPALSSFTGDASMQDLSLHAGTGAAFLGGTPGPAGTWIYGIGHFTYPGGIFLPSELVKIATHDLTNWWFTDQYFTLAPELNRMTKDEGAFSGYGQLADPSVAQGYDLAGNVQTVMVYDAIEDQVAASGSFKLKVAVSSKGLDDTLNFRGNGQLQVPGLATFWSNVEIGNPGGEYDRYHVWPEVLLTGGMPGVSLNSKYAQVDSGRWDIRSLNGQLEVDTVSDDLSVHVPVVVIARASTNVTSAYFRTPHLELYDIPGNSNLGLRFRDTYGTGANDRELMSADAGSGLNIPGFFRQFNWTHMNDEWFTDTNGNFGIGPQAGGLNARFTVFAKTNTAIIERWITGDATNHPLVGDSMSYNPGYVSMVKGQTNWVLQPGSWLAPLGVKPGFQLKSTFQGDADNSDKHVLEMSIPTGSGLVPALSLDGYYGKVGVALPLYLSNSVTFGGPIIIPAETMPSLELNLASLSAKRISTNKTFTNTWSVIPADGQQLRVKVSNTAGTNITYGHPLASNGRALVSAALIPAGQTRMLTFWRDDGINYVFGGYDLPGWQAVTLDTTNAVVDLGQSENFHYTLSTSNFLTFSNLVSGAQGTVLIYSGGTPKQLNFSSEYLNVSTNELAPVIQFTNWAWVAYQVTHGTDPTNLAIAVKRQ
jgi:hypothetical protein